MRVKRILQGGEKSRLKAKEGIDLVADIIKTTLGPKGRNCLLKDLGPLAPRIINDGVSIAEKIQSEDCFVNAGVEMVKEICKRTNLNAGDGTTTTALLAKEIIGEAHKRLIAGENPIDLKNEIEGEVDGILEMLSSISHKAETKDEIRNIATIAANNDEEVGGAIAEIIDGVGKNASILVEKSDERKLKTNIIKGIYFDRGWRVPAFVNSPHMKSILNDAYVCVTDKKLNWDNEIEEFFQKIAANQLDKIVLIASEFGDNSEVLATLSVTNKAALLNNQGLHLLAVEAPEYGQTKDEILEDICIMTGATLISDKTGFDFKTSEPLQVMGKCEKIVSDSKTTTIVGGGGKKEEVEKRIEDLKAQIEQLDYTEKITREKLEKRLSILESGVGIIYAGGATDIERKDRDLRLEDAILATRSAVKSGYVAGGGYTYLKLGEKVNSLILKNAFESVMRQVAINSGKNPDTIIEKAKEGQGWNAKNGEFGDLIEMGVVDATLVLENSIKNAISLASLFITMENMVVEDEDREEIKK